MILKFAEYNNNNNTLTITHNAGLLSIASVTIYNLIEVYKNTTLNDPIKVIWTSPVWSKTKKIQDNVFDLYFKQSKNNLSLRMEDFDTSNIVLSNNILHKINYKNHTIVRDRHFILSDEVKNQEESYKEKYSTDLQKTIVLYYRGTDKLIEVPKIHPKFYLGHIKELIEKNPDYKVLVQTDQTQVLNYYQNELKDKMYYIQEVPTTDSDKVMHTATKNISNYELGIRYLAAISLISKCKYVVMDTGNGPVWICIFRGGTKNTCQVFPTIQSFKNFED